MQTPSDREWLERAFARAVLGPLGDPNPRVGCVIVRDGDLLAQGHHRGAGTAHAEADALAQAVDVAGATAYVTLEPCAHVGRTPSCARSLIDAGVARVVYAGQDPSELAGGGADLLREAGIEVAHAAEFQERAEALNPGWTFSVRMNRPRVVWKYAATLDGRIAAADGTSQWITGPAARAEVHALRTEVGAVVVGTGTALADDPALTVRGADGTPADRQPLRVVVGERDLPAGAKLLDGSVETVHLRTHDPRVVLDELHRREVRDVLLEGGGTLAAAFLRAGLVDHIVAFVAPTLLGSGTGVVGDLAVGTLADAHHFTVVGVRPVGDDVRIDLDPRKER